MMTILIILIVVTVIALVVNGVDSKHPQTEPPKQDGIAEDESCNFSGTLTDRNVAALNYVRMRESLRKNSNNFKDLPDGVMENFDYVASHLATIGTNARPEDVLRGQNGLPAGWGLDEASKKPKEQISGSPEPE